MDAFKRLFFRLSIVFVTFTPAIGAAQAPGPDGLLQRAWQPIHGTVASIQRATFVLRTDDGRTLVVNAASIAPALRSLSIGDGVTVVGMYRDDASVVARFVQPDSSTPSASPR